MADRKTIGNVPLHDNISVTATSDEVIPEQKTPGDMGIFEVVVHSGGSSVVLQGKSDLSPTADGWQTITTLAATGVERVALMHHMRSIATVTTGSVSAFLSE